MPVGEQTGESIEIPPPLFPWGKDSDQEKNLGIEPGPRGGKHSQPKPRFS